MTHAPIKGKNKYERVRAQLELERESFRVHWRDLNDYILPRRARFFVADVNKGERRNLKIIDSTGSLAARTLRSGMMSGITSPARPWFKLTVPDFELGEVSAVKQWLDFVTQRMSSVFLKSNLYNVLPLLYGDLGVFATGAIYQEEDFNNVTHFYSFPIGSYMIGVDPYGRVNKFSREFQMTVHQIVSKFGQKNPNDPKDIDWTNISDAVKAHWDNNTREAQFWICHVIMPNDDYINGSAIPREKRFAEAYYEKGGTNTGGVTPSNRFTAPAIDSNKFLLETGRDFFPVMAPRWEVTGEDSYGTTCPGMMALGDIKQLQIGERRSMQAVEKMINPPMTGPTSLRNHKASILPGDITYSDVREGQQGFRPAHEVRFDINSLELKQEQTRDRIRRAFYEDLFLMLTETDRRQITATEVVERKEEKLLALGPVLEQLNQDLLDPLIDNTFLIMNRQGLIPPPPEEIAGADMKVEYISVMAQAQKLVGLGTIDRFTGFVQQLAASDPTVADKVNMDEMVNAYADTTGVPSKVTRTNEEAEEIRAQRQQRIQQEQAAQQAQSAAQTAKDLSEIETGPDTALNDLSQAAAAGGIV